MMDEFSNHRGTKISRLETGFISHVYDPVSDEPLSLVINVMGR